MSIVGTRPPLISETNLYEPRHKANGNEIYSLSEEFAYRVLFCKDVFFEEEREFRFVLPEDHILMGTSYPVNLTEEYKIEELEAFIREH